MASPACLADAEIAAVLREVADTGLAVEALVAAANTAGGADNITAVLVDVHGETKPGDAP